MKSLWSDISCLPEFDKLNGNAKTDVLIIGGGIAGILCAYKLQNAGIDYMLIESDGICRGVTANTTAKVTSQHGLIYDSLIRRFGVDKARLYLKANQNALEEYRKICQKINCDFEIKNSYVYSTDSSDKIEKELKALDKLGFSANFLQKLPLPINTVGAVEFKDQAQLDPLKFIAHISKNLNIYEKTAARSYDGKSIITDRGKITASKIIVATHFPIINKHGSYFLKMYQHRSYVIALENAPDVNGMYVDENLKGLSFRNSNGMLLLGGGSHRTGKSGGSWDELISFYRKHYPNAQLKYRWATQDCMTLDSVPYIGNYSKNTSNLYVATGFNKWGMTSSMVAAMLLCDMVRGKENLYNKVFSPSRTVVYPQLFINAGEAVLNLATPTTPRCPHMGCALKWNLHEHTWDCPCHGSRFTESGTLINNPATNDMKK